MVLQTYSVHRYIVINELNCPVQLRTSAKAHRESIIVVSGFALLTEHSLQHGLLAQLPRSKAATTRKYVVNLQIVLPIYFPQWEFLKDHAGFI